MSNTFDSPREFARRPSAEKIRSTTARMWFVSALGKGGGQILQLTALMVLARIIAPEEFGLIAMAMVFVGVAEIFRDFGLSAATVQAPSLTNERASAMFIANFTLGCFMAGAMYIGAPLAGLVYSDIRVVPIIEALSLTFFFNGIGAQHQALLRRQLKFGVLAIINLVVVAFSQALAIVLALKGFGYWSLVAAGIGASIVRMAAVWIAYPWSPVTPVYDDATKKMLAFGGYLALFGLIGFIANNTHSLIIGERYGAADVGFFSRAFVLLGLILGYVMAPFATVVPAALSSLLGDAEDYKSMYLHYLAMMMCVTAPAGFLVALNGEDIIRIVLGDKWISSAIILQILALATIPRTISASSGWLYQSHGDSRSMLYWGFGGWAFLLAVLLVGAQFGIVGVAIAHSSGVVILLFPCMYFAFRNTSLRIVDLRVVLPIIGAAIFALVTTLPVWWWLGDAPSLVRLLVVILMYGVVYLWVLVSLFGQRELIAGLVRQLKPGVQQPALSGVNCAE